MTDHENELHIKVNTFKSWAKFNYPQITEENDNGEWCFCDEFYGMISCAFSVIQKCSATSATKQIIDDLLYAIARDNECESIVEDLLDHLDWFVLLCRQCLKPHYTNAKWQFVKRLCDYTGNEKIRELYGR